MPNRVKPPSSAEAITPSDTDVFKRSRGFMVTAAGNLNVKFAGDDTTIVLPGLLPGVMYPAYLTQILATDTTATGIIVLR